MVRVGTTRAPKVVFYRAISDDKIWQARTMTDEVVSVQWVDRVPALPVIPNLRWLIPLAAYTADTYAPFTVQATAATACDHPALDAMRRAGETRPFYCYICGERAEP